MSSGPRDTKAAKPTTLTTLARKKAAGEPIVMVTAYDHPSACIAEEVGISTRQLERLFGRYLNTSPKRYMMEMRLHRARNLIVQTEQSIAEIAMACGFKSTSHFTKTFRAHYGRTPLSQRTTLN